MIDWNLDLFLPDQNKQARFDYQTDQVTINDRFVVHNKNRMIAKGEIPVNRMSDLMNGCASLVCGQSAVNRRPHDSQKVEVLGIRGDINQAVGCNFQCRPRPYALDHCIRVQEHRLKIDLSSCLGDHYRITVSEKSNPRRPA